MSEIFLSWSLATQEDPTLSREFSRGSKESVTVFCLWIHWGPGQHRAYKPTFWWVIYVSNASPPCQDKFHQVSYPRLEIHSKTFVSTDLWRLVPCTSIDFKFRGSSLPFSQAQACPLSPTQPRLLAIPLLEQVVSQSNNNFQLTASLKEMALAFHSSSLKVGRKGIPWSIRLNPPSST